MMLESLYVFLCSRMFILQVIKRRSFIRQKYTIACRLCLIQHSCDFQVTEFKLTSHVDQCFANQWTFCFSCIKTPFFILREACTVFLSAQTDPTNIACTAVNSTTLQVTWDQATDASVLGYYLHIERVDGVRIEPDIPVTCFLS